MPTSVEELVKREFVKHSDFIAPNYAAANRDPRELDRPNECIIERSPKRQHSPPECHHGLIPGRLRIPVELTPGERRFPAEKGAGV